MNAKHLEGNHNIVDADYIGDSVGTVLILEGNHNGVNSVRLK
ncbi:hypothetical protein [Capnocytophaga canimorsus]|uniref:Uncharacterized protein n=1 Tax=Capnocytophaga canimorsus (strain 5) TaxID=860228 RepID=F9YP82_CAPCC|nr:hypothetical protein [Capnocytophaga canimorsus]AEK23276.1 Hypothetical protein Ccan_11600 [Capnocytophaga canimorsus Cc5]WGU67839.1 hypothetical protein QIU19_10450 [Capnocytophaga canimorsus]WGU71040.1 hypothetical protein QIU18_03320 [Capnocytophaga canimorsus]